MPDTCGRIQDRIPRPTISRKWLGSAETLLLMTTKMTAVILLTLLVGTTDSIAETYVDSNISSDTTWTTEGSPYILTSNVIIGSGKTNLVTLTVEPGVTVKFNPGTYLKVGHRHSNISYKLGALSAVGTAEAPIVFTSAAESPQPGDWQGLNVSTKADDTMTIFDHCVIEFGGDTLGANIYIDNASPTIKNSVIRYSSADGVKVIGKSNPEIGGDGCGNTVVNNNGSGINFTSADSFPVIENNTVSDNGAFAMLIPAYMNSAQGNTGTGNGEDKILLLSSNVRNDCEWKRNDFPYLINHVLTVLHKNRRSDTATLKIHAGVNIHFGPGSGLKISNYNEKLYQWYGAIEAKGTQEAPIVFTSANQSPQPGDWRGIHFDRATDDGASILEHCIIEYGGEGIDANIYMNSASPTILSSTIRHSSLHGMRLQSNSDPIIGAEGNGNTIANNAGNGIYCADIYNSSVTDGSEPTISHNVISNNGASPMRIRPAKTIARNNTGVGNAVNAITFVPEEIRYDTIWYKNAFPYLVEINHTVMHHKKRVLDSALLTIRPGVAVKFAPDAKLSIGYYWSRYSWYCGALDIQGTKNEPVLFTSNQHEPAIGDWPGIYFNTKTDVARSRIRHAIIEYGGGSGEGNLHFHGTAVPVENSVIRKSSSAGIRYSGNIAQASTVMLCTIEDNAAGIYSDTSKPPLVKYNRLQNNQTAGIYNNWDIEFNGDGTDVYVNARHNWWGAVSGPTGSGDSAYGLVHVDPWAIDPEDLDRDNVWDPYELDFFASLEVINTAPDDDNDEMNDDWEYRYGLDLASNDAYLDLDGDGYFNIIEYRYDINPSSFAEAPDIGVHYEYDALGRITRIYRFR